MQTEMVTKKTAPTRATRKPRNSSALAPKLTRADGRVKSKLTLAGEEGALRAKRDLLLITLDANGWNLSATARDLDMSTAGAVIRALNELAPDEYERAKRDGRVSPGKRPLDA